MAINEDTDIFQYIFVAANSLQVRLAQDVGLFFVTTSKKNNTSYILIAPFIYFFLIFQGFFIFVSHVLMNNKVSISMEHISIGNFLLFFADIFFLKYSFLFWHIKLLNNYVLIYNLSIKFILFSEKVMQGLRNKYPAFSLCKRKTKHRKIESVSISRNKSTTKFDSPLKEDKVKIVLHDNYKMIIMITIIIDPVVMKT